MSQRNSCLGLQDCQNVVSREQIIQFDSLGLAELAELHLFGERLISRLISVAEIRGEQSSREFRGQVAFGRTQNALKGRWRGKHG